MRNGGYQMIARQWRLVGSPLPKYRINNMDEKFFQETEFGFKRGCMEVTRFICDKNYGVLLEIKTPKEKVEIRATPSGLLRIFDVKKVEKT